MRQSALILAATAFLEAASDRSIRGNKLYDGAILGNGVVSNEPLRIYTGMLGQIGDIVMFTATARRVKELFPFP